ncbi:Diphthine--ammonia ligase [Cytospora mali]|uniref:Diphthine--ammonia ligase n=1 Tax=Cytospora mali TaxID=578113 RepID=A0A194VQP2_CYTMA|nr:Diphthine--ammonia ligase [Valsa mali]
MATPGAGPGATGGLNVIALVSGGKDSFFSALHCLEQGHRVVALANLHPPPPPHPPSRANAGGIPDLALTQLRLDLDLDGEKRQGGDRRPDGDAAAADHDRGGGGEAEDKDKAEVGVEAEAEAEAEDEAGETDLNSFMYQTVGHQVIPLYAEATGIPLYRRPILGGAVHNGRDYSAAAAATTADEDETESMIPLLREIMRKHPEANALSAGAILSTYQRTRVESVATRLGLTPLAYLWKYPILPGPAGVAGDVDEAQLLVDMAAAGMEARLLKVASGGLDESFLWENVASAKGVMRLKKAMGRFGVSAESGAVLGEGGEFETLVVDGPARLFKKRIVVGEDDRLIVKEGGGTAWLKIQSAEVEVKPSGDGDEKNLVVRKPELLDGRFAAVLGRIQFTSDSDDVEATEDFPSSSELAPLPVETSSSLQTWAVTRPRPVHNVVTDLSIGEETELLINEIRSRLSQHDLSPDSIISSVISLRRMSDFPAINKIYGSLFTEPNPPSRVTISCSDLLPQGTNIAIYLTVHTSMTDRQGLHVQGRSYWAPANIGPYSQAITFPIHSILKTAEASSSSSSSGPRVVHIAGQIPLVPASMELPTDTDGGFEIQLALSLQHLWRIGVEMGVQWWTSAAVYFPRNGGQTQQQRSKNTLPAREKALLAWRAWKVAHEYGLSSDDDDDDDEDGDGPDLWDRKFNPAYMTYGGSGDAGKKGPSLPDYSILQRKGDEDEEEDKHPVVPFFFAVEVDELPRSAEAEWHAHAGLSQVGSSPDSESPEQIAIRSQTYKTALGRCRVNHCALTSDAGVLLHSTAGVEIDDATISYGPTAEALDQAIEETNKLLDASMRRDELSQGGVSPPSPYLLYVDSGIFGQEQIGSAMRDQGLAVVPCASIYGGPQGIRLAVVALYRNMSPVG